MLGYPQLNRFFNFVLETWSKLFDIPRRSLLSRAPAYPAKCWPVATSNGELDS